MGRFLLFAAVVAGALLAGALIAWPAHGVLALIGEPRFHKVLSLTTSLAGLFLSFLYLGAGRGHRLHAAGWRTGGRPWTRDLPLAMAGGIAVVALLETSLLALGVHERSTEYLSLAPVDIFQICVAALVTGFLVAAVEETLFRGALLGGALRRMGAASALLLTSAVYASAHFIKYPPLPESAPPGWLTGLELLTRAFDRFGDPAVLDAALTLFTLGLLLGLMRLAGGHIIQCVGFHAGLVAAIQVSAPLTDYVPDTRYDGLVNAYDHQLGWLALFWLLAAGAAYAGITARRGGPLRRALSPRQAEETAA